MAGATILQAVPRLDTGGSEQAAIEIAEALARAGASALVATEGGRLATAMTEAGGEIVALPMASKNPVTMVANARRLARLIEARGVDLVHARSRAPAWSALIAARRTGRPFVTTYHGAYASPGPFKNVYNSVMARGDRVIANSRYTAALIAARHRVPSDRIRVIYRGVDVAKFAPQSIAPERLARLRAAWGVSERSARGVAGCPADQLEGPSTGDRGGATLVARGPARRRRGDHGRRSARERLLPERAGAVDRALRVERPRQTGRPL